MGNRGVLHNDDKEIVRPYKIKTWITCVLAFKNGKKRPRIGSLTGMQNCFFMDEATSFCCRPPALFLNAVKQKRINLNPFG